MATPKSQGKELHQLKLKLTKDPRTASIKIPTPTKQHSSIKLSTASSPADYAKTPPTKILKLSEVISVPVRNPLIPCSPTKAAPKSAIPKLSEVTSVPVRNPLTPCSPTKAAPKSATPSNERPTAAATHSPTVKSPKQHQKKLISEPVALKSPRKKQTVVVVSAQAKEVKQLLTSANPVVVPKSPKAKQPISTTSKASVKSKPPPLKLVGVKHETKQQLKKSQSILPTSRVRTIMKTNIKSATSDGPLNIGQDSVAVISKATEMFITELMKGAHKTSLECCHKEISYGHLAKTVRKDPEQNKFLYEILPEKVLVRDYLASLNSQDHDPSSKSTH